MSAFPRVVLLAVDGSEPSRRASQIAVDLCEGRSCDVHVLHVYATSQWTTPRTVRQEIIDRMRREGMETLEVELDHLRELGMSQMTPHVRVGRPTDEILRLRDEIHADLIVLGSRGMNAFQRVLLGSDAESVVRHAPCSVLLAGKE